MATTNGIDQTQIAGAAAAAPDPSTVQSAEKLRTLAAEFESMLVSQMLKQMRASLIDDDDKESGFGSNPLSETLYNELSLALSRAGGLGVGESMMQPLMRQSGVATDEIGPAVANFPGAPPTAAAGLDLAPMLKSLGGKVTSTYGWRQDPVDGSARFHKGTDIAVPEGRDVPAARAGKVVFAGELAGYGRTVVVAHDGRVSTRYAHLSEIGVKPGDQVAAGQPIGKSGSTGKATGPHLHFEVLEGGQPIDPEGLRY
jgi:murein DD-endopeptidase MepM/ murein hydrolase activator NlpD